MTIRLDPERNETSVLDQVWPDVGNPRVLEVGCGDGRLTRRYADRAGSVLAIDPDEAALTTFRETMPAALRSRIQLRVGRLNGYQFDEAAFDLVLLSWSL